MRLPVFVENHLKAEDATRRFLSILVGDKKKVKHGKG